MDAASILRNYMRILAIESSCDETAAAVVEDGRHILSNVVSTQIELHAKWGGVVPELASRRHLESIGPVVDQALSAANTDIESLDAIAVTYGPGLVGSLLVGLEYAKALAFAHGKPLIPVHHIAGHIHAPYLAFDDIPLPTIALVVSGGHTSLFLMKELGVYELLSRTRDDAAGEAYDKVAKLLGLGYPGGPIIDRLAALGRDDAVFFKMAKMSDGKPDFSFSGLKTAVLQHVKKHGIPPVGSLDAVPHDVLDLLASFQKAVITALLRRLKDAVLAHRPSSVILTGGVAANSRLRKDAQTLMSGLGVPLFIPPLNLTTDNAAMIAAAGSVAFGRGIRAGSNLEAAPFATIGV
ncbi:MAG: tRNA (adenosine(37)-N6)-threonylcarbamoyltransferase complex transferase subunit TsaD [Vicinamibacteria bacterium]